MVALCSLACWLIATHTCYIESISLPHPPYPGNCTSVKLLLVISFTITISCVGANVYPHKFGLLIAFASQA